MIDQKVTIMHEGAEKKVLIKDKYDAALASGTNEYTSCTMYLAVDSDGNTYHIYPYQIIKLSVYREDLIKLKD